MATDREISKKIETFNGINQQVDREAMGDFDFWKMQNLWERVIGCPETRGHSNNFSNTWTSNVTGIDNVNRIFKNTLDHKRIVALQGLEGPNVYPNFISLPSGVAASWVAGGTDPIGKASTWLAAISGHTDIGYTPKGIVLRFVGYGYDKIYEYTDATLISGFFPGTASRLRINLTAPVLDQNVTAIEVYAVVSCQGNGGNDNRSSIWVGTCDLLTQPTGNFDFYHAPISKVLASAATSATFGALSMAYVISAVNIGGGTLLPGKTYYVGCMPHYFSYNSNPDLCQNAWRQFGGGNIQLGLENILSIVLPPGTNAISVNYPPSDESPISFNSLLVSVGESPQLMIPYFVSNVSPASPNNDQIAAITSFPQNTPAVVDIEYLENTANKDICNLRFRQSDFSTNDTLVRIKDDGSTVPIFIARQSSVNRYDNSGAIAYAVVATSSGGSSPTLVISPNIASSPVFTDPLPAGTPVIFGGSVVPGGISAGQTYFWLTNGAVGGVSATPGGAPVAWSTAGTAVTMTIQGGAAIYNGFFRAVTSGGFNNLYNGGYYLPQPLIGQRYSFQDYQDLCYFVTGISNNPDESNPAGFLNQPVSGTNLYVSDGNVSALVVFDYSTDPNPIPQGTIIGLYQESLLISGGIECGDTVFFSRSTNPWNFEVPGSPGINQFFQVEGLGEWSTGFSVFAYSMVYVSPQSFLVVTKKNSTWILENLPTSFATPTFLIQISKAVGTPSGLTIVQTPVGVLYAHVDNVYMVKGGGDPVPIGDAVSYLLKQSDLSRAVAEYHDEQYKLSFYCSLYPGTVGYNNVEIWMDVKKMKQAQGKPDWKGPMIGRAVDYCEVESLTGDGVVYNLTRDRVCIDRQNIRVFKADVTPAESDTVITDFGTPVVSLIETKNYQVQQQDNNWNKLFTRTLWKVKTNLTTGAPLSANVTSYVDGVLANTKTVTFAGLAATGFTDQPQVYTMEFPNGRYRGRIIKKIFSTAQRVGLGGFELFYSVERRRIGS